MKTTVARAKSNIAVMGSVHLGWQAGDELLVEDMGDGLYRCRGVYLRAELLDFSMPKYMETGAGPHLQHGFDNA